MKNSTHLFAACTACGLLFCTPAVSQDGSLLEALRQRLGSSDAQSEEENKKNQQKLEKILSIVKVGVDEVIQALPEKSQNAISERRAAWMDAIASGFEDLKGEDIELWLDNSDNIILKSLSRSTGSPSINTKLGASRLPDRWWYAKHDQDLAMLLTAPSEPIQLRKDLPGPPVWFVNGIATRRSAAIEMGDALAEKTGRRVNLLYNPTFMEPPHTTGLDVKGFGKDDLSECLYDRLWPATVVNRLDKIGDGESLSALVADKISLQGNPTTRQLTYVLLTTEGPIDLVTHSQGCIIARNAFFSMAMLQQREVCEQQIAWIAAGIPLNDHELSPLPLQSSILDVGDDPIAKIVGLRGGTRQYKSEDHSFTQNYLKQIDASQFWTPQKQKPNPTRL